MERLSVHLWSILNLFFGCYEEIYIRRRNTYYYETLNKYVNSDRGIPFEEVLSGSRGEGLNLADSDFDFMTILNNFTVLPADSTQTQTSDIAMDTEIIKPGFARLRLSSKKILSQFSNDIVTQWNGGLYISSLLYRDALVEKCQKKYPGDYGHGPCSTHINRLSGKEFDNLLCFQCKVWPDVASEWVHRYRPNIWPSRELVNKIREDGCLLVPVGNPSSPTYFMEWRMSFSLAERKLVHSFNHTQFMCYGLLKVFLKYVINSNVTTKDLLCSYFLKTIIFYVIEEESLTWDKQNLLICFWICFKRLLLCVREGSCPNYFVKHNNLFEHKIVGVHKETLLQYLSSLYSEHFEVLARIPFFTSLFRQLRFNSELLSLPLFELGNKEFEYNCCIEVMGNLHLVVPTQVHEINIIQYFIQSDLFLTTTNIYDKEILIYHMYELNYECTQYLYQLYINRYRSLSNRSRYKYLTMLKNHIIHNCTGGDICTGLLQYATLCYLTGQCRRVVRVTAFVLSKFKPYTLVGGITKTSNIKCFKETICGNNLSISTKRRIAVAHFTPIIPQCKFYPPEIKPEILAHTFHVNSFCITPQVYVYILQFLSYQKLGDRQPGIQALDKLDEILCDEEFNSVLLPSCIDLVGKCRSLVN